MDRVAVLEQLLAEEQRRREAAEARAAKANNTALVQYLSACHELSLAMEIITDPKRTTKGDTTKADGR